MTSPRKSSRNILEFTRNRISKRMDLLCSFMYLQRDFLNAWKKCTVEWKIILQVINSPLVSNPRRSRRNPSEFTRNRTSKRMDLPCFLMCLQIDFFKLMEKLYSGMENNT